MNKKETLIDQFKTYVGAYYGVNSMDEYDLKVYVLKEIEKEIYEEEKGKRGKKKLITKYTLYLVLVGILLFLVGNLLSDTLKDLCNLFGVPEFLIGIVLGIATSIPELITFLESQKYHKEKEKIHGVVEATNNLLTSNMLNLFIIQSIGILLYMIVN